MRTIYEVSGGEDSGTSITILVRTSKVVTVIIKGSVEDATQIKLATKKAPERVRTAIRRIW